MSGRALSLAAPINTPPRERDQDRNRRGVGWTFIRRPVTVPCDSDHCSSQVGILRLVLVPVPTLTGVEGAMPVSQPTLGMGRVVHDFSRNPMLVYWEMTQACGLACRHCRAEAMAKPHPLELTTLEGQL